MIDVLKLGLFKLQADLKQILIKLNLSWSEIVLVAKWNMVETIEM